MKNQRILASVNADIRRKGDPDWWIGLRRVHPERQIRVPIVRGPHAETLARQFFAGVSQDAELLRRRAVILWQWYSQRREDRVTPIAAGRKR